MQQPKRGDIVTMKGLVTQVYPSGVFTFTSVNPNRGYTANSCCPENVVEIETPIRVGDKVKVDGLGNMVHTLLYIHQKPDDIRKWAVVAFEGDMPKTMHYSKLRHADMRDS